MIATGEGVPVDPEKCLGCGVMFYSAGEILSVPACCRECIRRYPASLLKAVQDPFQYALRLRTGEIIWFESAVIRGNYATLKLGEIWKSDAEAPVYPFPRGLDVRIADIVWCADAPTGS